MLAQAGVELLYGSDELGGGDDRGAREGLHTTQVETFLQNTYIHLINYKQTNNIIISKQNTTVIISLKSEMHGMLQLIILIF